MELKSLLISSQKWWSIIINKHPGKPLYPSYLYRRYYRKL